VLALCLVAVPINMAVGGWKLHDRSGNWIPWDYSYNILQSLDKNAILFTNGDNDTFPLWYLQDVAGVRRDVRVINLTLSNAPWYVWQLKHERPWKALQVPLSFDDSLLRVPEGSRQGLTYSFATPPTITLDVPAATMAWATDGKVKDASKMTWTLQGKAYGDRPEQLLRVQDKLIENIMENNGWRRPVYFSSTVGPDAWGGLEDYFRWEGMAYRVMPVKQGQLRSADAIDPAIMRASLMNTLGDEQSYTDQHYGFKFRNLTDRSVFYLEDHRQLIYNYRLLYVTLAIYEQYRAKNSPAAIATLDKLEQMISPDMFALSYPISAQIAEVYRVAGAKEKAERYARRTIALVDALGPDWSNVPDAQTSNPIDVKAQMYVALGDYDGAISTIDQLRQAYPGDPNVRARVEELRVERLLGRNDTAGAIAELKTIITSYAGEQAPAMRNNLAAFSARLAELTHTPAAPDGTRVDSSKAAPASK
jgi:tetratricopeptide (TPR) repeat protein